MILVEDEHLMVVILGQVVESKIVLPCCFLVPICNRLKCAIKSRLMYEYLFIESFSQCFVLGYHGCTKFVSDSSGMLLIKKKKYFSATKK